MYKKIPQFQKKVYNEILNLFKDPVNQEDKVYENFEALAKQNGPVVFQVLFDVVAHVSFKPAEARKLWDRIWEHKAEMERILGRKVDFRVALLEYFLEIQKKIKSPKIIEMSLFEKTMNSLVIDELTKLYNFRFFQNQLKFEISRSKRHHSIFSILLFDVDNFKSFNDLYGHEQGNRVLKKVAQTLSRGIRTTDMAFRYGGEEFVVFLYNTPKWHSMQVAEKLRLAVEKMKVKFGSRRVSVTVSGGIAAFPVDGKTPETLVNKADEALHISKSLGKNCVHFASANFRSSKRFLVHDSLCLESFSLKGKNLPVLDLSMEGLCFKSLEMVEPNTFHQIQLDSNRLLSFLVKIIRSTRTDGHYVVGGMFVNMDDIKRKVLEKHLALKEAEETSGSLKIGTVPAE